MKGLRARTLDGRRAWLWMDHKGLHTQGSVQLSEGLLERKRLKNTLGGAVGKKEAQKHDREF